MPSIEQLAKAELQIPTLVLECTETRRVLRFIRFHRTKLVFMGRLRTTPLLLMGKDSYRFYLSSTKYAETIQTALTNILRQSKLEEHEIVDWTSRKGTLTLQVVRVEAPKLTDYQNQT